jgi:L,D-peptidoglycan transpeptidase YkuD (ErfK/YbiS/YcfS/YnhG family)
MDVIVTPLSHEPTRGVLRCAGLEYPCALGRSGVRKVKIEGDGATPVGTFDIRSLFFRADRLAVPKTDIPLNIIHSDDGWCDAPNDACYNRLVRLPYPASAESLWRTDDVYDLVLVIGHNDNPIIAGHGSAIFVHVATPDYAPTAGCVALARDDLLRVLQKLEPGAQITIEDRAA